MMHSLSHSQIPVTLDKRRRRKSVYVTMMPTGYVTMLPDYVTMLP